MTRESIGLFVCILGVINFSIGAEHRSTSNVTIYNNLQLHDKLELPDHELLLLHSPNPHRWGLKLKHSRQDVLSHPKPCACAEGLCACCSGLLLGLFGQKACLKVKYSPADFAFDVSMTLNGQVLYENSVTGGDPAPMCINPPRIQDLKVCAKFSNVFFPGRNFHFCANMIGSWGNADLFDISFNCLRMGANGIAVVKPEDSGGLPIANPGGGVDAVVDSGVDDIEDYDENLVRSLFDIFERRRR